jgi:hypothetical protein
MKNIIVIVGVVVVGAAGVYLVSERQATQLVLSSTSGVSEEMLANTQLFIERSAILESLQLNTEVLNDTRLTSLQSYATPVTERPVGRSNPFEPAARSSF